MLPTTRSLARHCTTCGQPLRQLPDAHFCEACGAPLEHPDPPRPTGYLRRIAALTADWLLLPLWGKHQSICDRVTDTVVTPLMIAGDGNGRASGTNDAAALPAG